MHCVYSRAPVEQARLLRGPEIRYYMKRMLCLIALMQCLCSTSYHSIIQHIAPWPGRSEAYVSMIQSSWNNRYLILDRSGDSVAAQLVRLQLHLHL